MVASHRTDELAELRAEFADRFAAQEAAIARLKRRRHLPRRALPLLLAAALVALIPLATLAASPVFSDLGDAAEVHQANIVAVGDAGISTGVDDPNSGNPAIRLYNPKEVVTREEMASFLARAAGLGGNPPVANAATAQTVPDGSITPAKLSGTGSTAGQVLTSTGTGVAFQNLPTTGGVQNAIVRRADATINTAAIPPVASASVSCLANERATGGGYVQATGIFIPVGEDRPLFDLATNIPTGWYIAPVSGFPGPAPVSVYAICVPVP